MEIWTLMLLILLSGFFVMLMWAKTALMKSSPAPSAPPSPTTEEYTMPHRTATFLCALLLLTACSPNDNETPAPKLFKDQRDALDKARTVDSAQQKENEEQRKLIEQQTQ